MNASLRAAGLCACVLGGAHLTWMVVLTHPEKIRAAAISCGNFVGLCIDKVSEAPRRAGLPVRAFQGEDDEHRAALEGQFQKARQLAEAHGYRNISLEVVRGAGHVPLAAESLAYFDSLRRAARVPVKPDPELAR